jgi:hypothetical protein
MDVLVLVRRLRQIDLDKCLGHLSAPSQKPAYTPTWLCFAPQTATINFSHGEDADLKPVLLTVTKSFGAPAERAKRKNHPDDPMQAFDHACDRF